MTQYLQVYVDDNLITLMEKLSFHLMEMGIKVEVEHANDDCVIYRLRPADPEH